MPKNDLTPSIHLPPLGRLIAKVPTSQNGMPSPIEKQAPTMVPRGMLRVWLIQTRMLVSTGPVQGAATRPLTRPRRKAPP